MLKLLKRIAIAGIPTEKPLKPDPALRSIREQLEAEVLRRLGRALAIRHVDAGSCNACELELRALDNPYYALESLGIRFVASPRHADLLLVTGPITRNMEGPLLRAWEAMPGPKLLVAAGGCAVKGGAFADSPACVGALSKLLPVDIAIPGCPPTPSALMQGILSAVTNFRSVD